MTNYQVTLMYTVTVSAETQEEAERIAYKGFKDKPPKAYQLEIDTREEGEI